MPLLFWIRLLILAIFIGCDDSDTDSAVADISKSNKVSHKKSIKENLGMASKAAGTSTAPKKEVISESNDMVARFKKLANIKINE